MSLQKSYQLNKGIEKPIEAIKVHNYRCAETLLLHRQVKDDLYY